MKNLFQGRSQLGTMLGGHGSRRHDRIPDFDVHIAGTDLGHGRNAGRQGAALAGAHGQGGQLARLNQRHDRGGRQQGHLYLVAHQGVDHRRAAVIGHMLQIQSHGLLDQLHAQVAAGPRTHRAVVALGSGLECLEISPCIRGHGLGSHQHQRRRSDHGQRCEILDRIVGQLAVEKLGAGQRAVADDAYGVAVAGFGHGVSADIAAGPPFVLHHHGLTQGLGQGLGQQTGLHIGRRAAGIADDQTYGAGGPVSLALGLSRQGQTGRGAQQQGRPAHGHRFFCHLYVSRISVSVSNQQSAYPAISSINGGRRPVAGRASCERYTRVCRPKTCCAGASR